jgi:hypothetical protein
MNQHLILADTAGNPFAALSVSDLHNVHSKAATNKKITGTGLIPQ